MKSEDYWVIFTKSGKIEDYLRYRAIEDEEKRHEAQHKGIDSKGTEYR